MISFLFTFEKKSTFLKLTSKTYPYGYEDDFVKEMQDINVLPKNLEKDTQGNYLLKIGDSRTIFASHFDTACKSQTPVKHVIDGNIIKTDNTSILGADDKAGVAIIMDFAQFMMQNASILHGDIKILFTPDEEIGRGVEYIDMNRLNADFAYTLDGGPLGDIEDETFSADAMDVTFEGLSAHPGYAKGKMINAIKLAAEFVSKLPNTNLSPETTSGREGFVHPTSVSGGLESALVQFIIRDHDTSKLKIYEDFLVELAQSIVDQYKGSKFTFKVKEQYRNMKEELVKVPFVADYAVEAMIKANVTPKRAIIRGGTDGSRLSFMGLPCPNIFTGEMAIHSRHEYVSVQDMLAAKNTLIELVQIWTNHKTKNG